VEEHNTLKQILHGGYSGNVRAIAHIIITRLTGVAFNLMANDFILARWRFCVSRTQHHDEMTWVTSIFSLDWFLTALKQLTLALTTFYNISYYKNRRTCILRTSLHRFYNFFPSSFHSLLHHTGCTLYCEIRITWWKALSY